MPSKKQLEVKLVRSLFGRKPGHKETIYGLGLKKIRQTRVLEDTPSVRGMINKVSYLVEVKSL